MLAAGTTSYNEVRLSRQQAASLDARKLKVLCPRKRAPVHGGSSSTRSEGAHKQATAALQAHSEVGKQNTRKGEFVILSQDLKSACNTKKRCEQQKKKRDGGSRELDNDPWGQSLASVPLAICRTSAEVACRGPSGNTMQWRIQRIGKTTCILAKCTSCRRDAGSSLFGDRRKALDACACYLHVTVPNSRVFFLRLLCFFVYPTCTVI